jgi:hypothetical protein
LKGQCCAYIYTVSNSNDTSNQQVGTIQCSITDGQTLLSDGAGMDAWQSVGLNLMVSLPHNGQDGIVNVLYSPTVAAYLK